jgi:protein gp37
MTDGTGIEWTHRAGTKGETWNPIVGCSIATAGCINCYAMTMASRIEAIDAAAARAGHYAGTTKNVKGKPVWTGRIGVAPDHIFTAPLRWRAPRTVFVNSMSDLFHEDVPDAVIDRVFAVMAMSPQHTFQVLTKRSARMREYMSAHARNGDFQPMMRIIEAARAIRPDDLYNMTTWPLPNVWLGVSAERRTEWLERTADLRKTPAAIRFVSIEPLLGDLGEIDLAGLHWIITGGESGKGARPMHPDWPGSIGNQCARAGVAYFHKQNGAFRVVYDRDRDDPDWRRCDAVAAETPQGRWLNLAGGHGFHGERLVRVVPTTKKVAGRLLAGVEHNGFPEIREVPFG